MLDGRYSTVNDVTKPTATGVEGSKGERGGSVFCAVPPAAPPDVGSSESAAGNRASEGSSLHCCCTGATLLSCGRLPWSRCRSVVSAVSALTRRFETGFAGRRSFLGCDPDAMRLSACSSLFLSFSPARVSARGRRMGRLLRTVCTLSDGVLCLAALGGVFDFGPVVSLVGSTAGVSLPCGLRGGRGANAVRHDARFACESMAAGGDPFNSTAGCRGSSREGALFWQALQRQRPQRQKTRPLAGNNASERQDMA
jgi:hypothetical protein